MEKYRLINYFDVWGNEIDGWEINNQCSEGEDFYISNESSAKEVCEYLKSAGYLRTSDMRKLYVDFSTYNGCIEIYQKKGMCPLFRFEKIA